jgi:C1A family cysteine protease
MRKLIVVITLTLSISSNAQSVKRIPGCLFKEDKNSKEFTIPKTRGISDNPSSFSLKKYYPPIGNQGQFGTCTAWATTYASFTALNNIKNNELGSSLKEVDCFSPQLTYDLIKFDYDKTCGDGSYIGTALKMLKRVGSVKLSEYPYNCNTLIDGNGIERLRSSNFGNYKFNEILTSASKNRLEDFIELGNNNVTDKIKYALNNRFPVVIGVSDFKDIETNQGNDTWIPEVSDFSLGGHAMSVVSYDDNKNGGSFELMNSWGNEWGKSGYCWIRYTDFERIIRDAYALTSIDINKGKNEFYDFNVDIKLIGDDSKLFSFKSDSLRYHIDDFYLGTIDKSSYAFLYDEKIKKFQIALNSNSDLYFYLISKSPSENVILDYPVNSSDNNFLSAQNSGIIIPKDARSYFNIDNFSSWYNKDFLLLFSKKPLNIESIINSNKNVKFFDLKSFVKDVFNDNIVLSDLTMINDNDWFSDENNKMNVNVSNDINYILPIIINLETKSIKDEEIIDEVIIEKPKK